MTEGAQRIAIAEACPAIVEWHDGKPYWKGSWSVVGEGNEHFAEFSPLSDLNAMHEAEKVLTDDNSALYFNHLKAVQKRLFGSVTDAPFQLVHATAAQRCEAFLRTLNLWKP